MFGSDSFFFHQLFGAVGSWWPHCLALSALTLSLVASCHAILHKKDSRSAVAWVGLIWLSPIIGAFLYLVLGINHIRRQAKSLRQDKAKARLEGAEHPFVVSDVGPALGSFSRLGGQLTGFPLLGGNRIEPLQNGDEAYGPMLEAIAAADKTIALSSYIFDSDQVGARFVEALGGALARGVSVRVLVDDVGRRYSRPSILHALDHRGIPVATFLPLGLSGGLLHFNLRNHRKILVVDGRIGFTGGLNIREGNLLSLKTKQPTQDTHFKLQGPIVGQLLEVFTEDWEFATGQRLDDSVWWTEPEAVARGAARVIPSGPELDYEPLRMLFHGAIGSAQSTIRITTPYFLPDPGLMTALGVAARRGVVIDILIPEKSNLPYVDWATATLFRQLLENGCRLWLSPPPFDHSKLMLVDNLWALFGSPNWDNRSLRLNFEVAVESYDPGLCHRLDQMTQEKLRRSRPVTREAVEAKRLGVRLRNGVARLVSPYL